MAVIGLPAVVLAALGLGDLDIERLRVLSEIILWLKLVYTSVYAFSGMNCIGMNGCIKFIARWCLGFHNLNFAEGNLSKSNNSIFISSTRSFPAGRRKTGAFILCSCKGQACLSIRRTCRRIFFLNGENYVTGVVSKLLCSSTVTSRELDASLMLLETLRGLGLDGIVMNVRIELVAGMAVTVHGDMRDKRVIAFAVDIVLGTRVGVLAVAIRHLGISGDLAEGHVDLVELPVDLEEAGTCLREGGRDGDAHDSLVAVHGGDADGLAVIVIGVFRLVVAVLELTGRVDADMAASQVEVCGVGDLHTGRRGLRVDCAGALDGVVAGLQGGDIHALGAECLVDGLRLIAAAGRVLNCRHGVSTGRGAGVLVVAVGVEGHADIRCRIELPGTDVVHVAGECLGGDRGEEVADGLAGIVRQFDLDGADAGRSELELERACTLIVGPHVHIAGVLDAVRDDGIDRAVLQRLAGGLVLGENDLRVGSEDIDLGGSVLGDIPVHAVLGDLDADAVLCALVCSCIEKLDTGGSDLELALLVLLGILLRHIDETGGIVEHEAVAHLGVGVVLGGAPIGKGSTGDAGAGVADIVVGMLVEVIEDRMADCICSQRVCMVRHAIAVIVGPEVIERRVREDVGVDDRGGHGEYILLLQLVAEPDVLGIGVLLDIGLLVDSLVCLTLLDLNGLEDRGAVRTVLIEHGGNGGTAGHLEGADPVLERDGGGVAIGVIEDGEAVGEIPVSGRGLDCDRLADIHRNGLGVVIPADKRQVAVLGISEGDGCRVR